MPAAGRWRGTEAAGGGGVAAADPAQLLRRSRARAIRPSLRAWNEEGEWEGARARARLRLLRDGRAMQGLPSPVLAPRGPRPVLLISPRRWKVQEFEASRSLPGVRASGVPREGSPIDWPIVPGWPPLARKAVFAGGRRRLPFICTCGRQREAPRLEIPSLMNSDPGGVRTLSLDLGRQCGQCTPLARPI